MTQSTSSFYFNASTAHLVAISLFYSLVISMMVVVARETPATGLYTLHCNCTVLSRPSGVQVNVFPVAVWPIKDQV